MPGGSIRGIWPYCGQASDPQGAEPPQTGCEKDFTSSGFTLRPWSGGDEQGREGSDRSPHLWRNLSPRLAMCKTQPISFSRALWKVLTQAENLLSRVENSGLSSPSLLYLFCVASGLRVAPVVSDRMPSARGPLLV